MVGRLLEDGTGAGGYESLNSYSPPPSLWLISVYMY